MAVLTFTIIFAVLNICLGFTLAIYLGYGPAGFRAAWNILNASHMQVILEPSVPFLPTSPSLPAETVEEPLSDSRQEMLAEGGEKNRSDGTTCESDNDRYHDFAAELLKPSPPENWDFNEQLG